MKKKYFYVLVFSLCLSINASPQTISQLIAQLALDNQKLSGLRNILNDMYSGYRILYEGYEGIKSLAKGNFQLHQVYLDGLWAVSATVRQDPNIRYILTAGHSLTLLNKSISARIHANPFYSPQEQTTLQNILLQQAQHTRSSLEELSLVAIDGQLRMSDAERLQSIDKIAADLSGQISIVRQLQNGIDAETLRRTKEANDLHLLNRLYGIQK